MTRRSYGHYCPLAQTLDAVGERWGLLVIRELLGGPQRYTDLQQRLPGIGPNRLATRLRELESASLVARRVLPPPAASTVYELTDQGALLEPAVLALARFGVARLRPLAPVNTFRPAWAALALRALAGTGPPPPTPRRWEVRVETERFLVTAGPAGFAVSAGPATEPATVVETDTVTAFALARGETTVEGAAASGLLRTTGDAADLAAWARFHALAL
jgi:DNA-binding HxlR family transcriptional regulator